MKRARIRVSVVALTALAAVATVGLAAAPATAAPAATGKIGDLYYAHYAANGLTKWTASGELTSLPGDASGSDNQLNANVSPNGQWLSWVDTNNNTLHVVNTSTGEAKIVRNNVDGVCVVPSWSPDNRRLLMADVTPGPDNYRLGILDITTGQYTMLPNVIHACHPFWSADGRSIAYMAGGGIFVANTDGSNVREVPGLGEVPGPYAFGLSSVSPRADRVIVAWAADGPGGGEAYRNQFGATVLDVRTGKKIAIPVQGELIKAQFRKDGSMLVRVKGKDYNQLVLVSAAGSIVKRVNEPAAVKDKMLLTV
jgi:Tol biopolymer transport system component